MQNNPRIAQAKPAPTSEEGDICLYPSKRCKNPRALKENGQLHTFCELHRGKANLNQRRMEHKRRAQLAQLEQKGVSQTPSPGIPVPGSQPPPAQPKDDASETLLENRLDLDEEEIRILLELLSTSSEEGKSD
ncbi:hypothetical protein BBJ28_00000369 [Nothophytophthora sp. Chile5]|nr:hypothetical protein BBJ28_00000369 [Nothophytophthora sp. Chile5]